MILSFSRSFAFIAVPRTATHAVRECLRPALADSDWEQCTRFERRVAPPPGLAAIGHGHLTPGELRPFVNPGIWEGLFRFAFVRDPVERFVSAYQLLHRSRPASDPRADMKALIADPMRRRHILFRPQSDFVIGTDGAPSVDFIGRYDRLEADLAEICARIGIAAATPPRINAAPRPAPDAVDAELRRDIEELYAADYAIPELESRG